MAEAGPLGRPGLDGTDRARAQDGAQEQEGAGLGDRALTLHAGEEGNPDAPGAGDVGLSARMGLVPGPALVPSVPETAGEVRLPPVSEARRLPSSRLLPSKYSESVLTRIVDQEEDLQLIFALDNATNERLLAEQNLRLGITARELVFTVPHYRIINAAFTHPHPLGGRFSMPFRGAWYAGLELATAKAEVLFHRTLQFAEIQWDQREELEYDEYVADFTGSFHDLRGQPGEALATAALGQGDQSGGSLGLVHAGAQAPTPGEFAACLHPRSYVASQSLAIHLLEAGSPGILYPSARRPKGHCIACFRPALVANVRKRDLYRLTWYPDRAATFVRCPRGTPGTASAESPAEPG